VRLSPTAANGYIKAGAHSGDYPFFDIATAGNVVGFMQLSSKQLQFILVGSFLSLALYFSGFFVLWTPLPLFYLSLDRDRRPWQFSLILVCFVALIFYGLLLPNFVEASELLKVRFFGVGYLFFYLVVAVLLSLGSWKRWPITVWGWKAGWIATSLVLVAGFFCQQFGIFDIQSIFNASLEGTTKMLDEMMTQPELHGKRAEIVPFVTQTKEWLHFLPNLMPSFLFIFTIIVLSLNIGLLKIIKRKEKVLKWVKDFGHLEVPHFCLWSLIAAGLAYFANVYLFGFAWLKIVALNVIFAAGFIYFMQGLSITAFFLRRFSPLFRFGVYGLVFLFLQMLGILVMGIGLADAWFDFRKLHKKP